MKKTLKMVTLLLLVAVMLFPAFQVEAKSKTKTMKVCIYKISGNTVYYRKAKQFFYYFSADGRDDMGDWGYGKTYKIKLTGKTKYYRLVEAYGNPKVKTTKNKYKKLVKYHVSLSDPVYYSTAKKKTTRCYPGLICRMTYSGKKAKKFVEVFQS